MRPTIRHWFLGPKKITPAPCCYTLFLIFLHVAVFASLLSGTSASAGTAARTGKTAKGMISTTSAIKHKATAHKHVEGTIASVDASAKSFVVHAANGADVTLKINDKTQYKRKGAPVSANPGLSGWTCLKEGEAHGSRN